MKIYVLNRLNTRPLHFLRKTAVTRWLNHNPGECRSWHAYDVLDYVGHLHDKIDELERIVEWLRSRLNERTED